MNRRDFIRASTAGLAAATIPAAGSGRAQDNIVREAQLGSLRSASPSDLQGLLGDGRQRRILLRGGVVLSLDPRVGDFEKADVLIDGKRIAEVAPTVSAGDAEIVSRTEAQTRNAQTAVYTTAADCGHPRPNALWQRPKRGIVTHALALGGRAAGQ